ncbi:MAG: B12-binding domain-containing protein [Oligoflexia bacterium]|nr:B12-binding domain-containing protein [Oligoflexia bacterium]MBF0366330.1 B12-binding domain-containing protein [Oligoflexia bacterium]
MKEISRGESFADQLISNNVRIKAFFDEVIRSVLNKDYTKTKGLVNRVEELQVDHNDMIIGLFQPLLYQIGSLWEHGVISISQEHVFTNIIQSAIDNLYIHNPQLTQYLNSSTPKVLLTCVNGNHHTIGIRILEFYLAMKRIPVLTVLPSIPNMEIISLIKEYKLKTIGLSISLPYHLSDVLTFYEQLNQNMDLQEKPGIIIGGFPVRRGLKLPAEIDATLCNDFKIFSDHVLTK